MTAPPAECVADKGYHSRAVLRALNDSPWKTRIAAPKQTGFSRWHGDEAARRAVTNNRARLKSGVAREAFKLRAEIVERCFAHNLDRGGMRRTLAAMTSAFASCGFEFRFNTRSLGIEYLTNSKWTRLDDRYAASAQETIGARFFIKTERGPRPLHFGRERWGTCLDAYLQDRQIDPFEDYLSTLPPWDRMARLNTYLADLFGVQDGDLERWVGRYLFLACVQRTFEPACLLREMPVLIGEQNIGKSALTRAILPQDIPGLHSDGLRWDSHAAQMVDATRGRALIEVSEMAGRSRLMSPFANFRSWRYPYVFGIR